MVLKLAYYLRRKLEQAHDMVSGIIYRREKRRRNRDSRP